MSTESLFVLAVALVTWGGVFLYMLRLERLARDLERRVQELNHRKTETSYTETFRTETEPENIRQ